MLEGGGELVTFGGIVAEPVEELGEAPLVGVDAAAPLDGFEVASVGEGGDLLGLAEGAVIAPEVVVVERLHVGVDGDDAGAGGVEGDGFDLVAGDAGLGEDVAHGGDEGGHLVGVGLGGEVGVFALAMEGVAGGGGAEAAALAVEETYAGTEGSEIDSGDDAHAWFRLIRKRYLAFPTYTKTSKREGPEIAMTPGCHAGGGVESCKIAQGGGLPADTGGTLMKAGGMGLNE